MKIFELHNHIFNTGYLPLEVSVKQVEHHSEWLVVNIDYPYPIGMNVYTGLYKKDSNINELYYNLITTINGNLATLSDFLALKDVIVQLEEIMKQEKVYINN